MASKSNAATVQGTNDSSIVSKHAMVEAGYAHDPFLKMFTQKNTPRRAPLINRGYYIRTKAIDSVIQDFLSSNNKKQIISLGAGFDTTYFRLSASSNMTSAMKNVYYVEVDFPEVAQRKKHLMKFNGLCEELNEDMDISTHNAADSAVKISLDRYCLIGADLGELTCLDNLLTNFTNLQRDLPTLILSECVMTYMDSNLSTDLISFCHGYFGNSLFVTYEQVEPSDAFGQFMRSHFDKLNSSLKGICMYSDKGKQVDRYKSCGYTNVDAFTMKEFYNSLPSAERKRVKELEYFDEYEEWHLKCFHYLLVLARSHSNLPPALELRIQSIPQYNPVDGMTSSLSTFHASCGAEQFAHASCVTTTANKTALLTHGGFGLQDAKVCRELQYADVLPCRLHHTLTAVDSSTIFVFGGRLSPAKALAEPALLRLTSDNADVSVKVEMLAQNGAEEPEARWRHAATLLSINGDNFVLITGGVTVQEKSCSPTLLASCYLFDLKRSNWSCLPDYPYPIHSHSVCYDGSRYVYSVGGLDDDETPRADCYVLDLKLPSLSWSKLALPIDNVYSHSIHIVGDMMLLVGGIGSAGQQMHLTIVKLSSHSVQSISLPTTIDHSLRMYFNHKSHVIRDESGQTLLLLVGGGGNCFSFGTHINKLISIHALDEL